VKLSVLVKIRENIENVQNLILHIGVVQTGSINDTQDQLLCSRRREQSTDSHVLLATLKGARGASYITTRYEERAVRKLVFLSQPETASSGSGFGVSIVR